MKKIFLIVSIFSFGLLFSQTDKKIDYGITAGYNFNSFDDLKTTATLGGVTEKINSKEKSGYHAGVYLRINLPKIYIRPEIIYTALKSEFNSATYDQSQIDVPVMVGYNLVGPLSVFAGPSFQYYLENKFENFDPNEIDIEKDLAVNFQFGLAVQIGSQIRLDARYEKGLSKNVVTFLDQQPNNVISALDTKAEQFIISLSLHL